MKVHDVQTAPSWCGVISESTAFLSGITRGSTPPSIISQSKDVTRDRPKGSRCADLGSGTALVFKGAKDSPRAERETPFSKPTHIRYRNSVRAMPIPVHAVS